jgi:hypothetical protein
LRRQSGEQNAQYRRGDDADQNSPAALRSGRPAAARPMTTALSPASTRSIRTTSKSAVRTSAVRIQTRVTLPLLPEE